MSYLGPVTQNKEQIINYVTNGRATSGGATSPAAGWSLYNDGVNAQPVDGSGGVATVTWTRSTTTPLRSGADFNFTTPGGSVQGQGVATDITIDLADQAKVLTVSFDYEVLSGTYATGDLTVYLIADPSGTPVVIQPAGYQIQSGTAGTKLKQIATFQTQATGQSYRVCFHVASTSTSAYSLAIDNVVVGPQTVQYGAPVTDWVDFTPTFLNATTLNATGKIDPQGRYRRVGDSIEVQVTFQNGSGGAAAGTGDVALRIPAQLTVDTTKLTATVGGYRADGFGTFSTSTTPGQGVIVLNNHLYLLKESSNDYYKIADLSASARWSVKATVPIQGWASTVQMSNDTDTRVVAANLASGTATLGAAFSDVSFTVIRDTHGAFGTTTYTVPVSGFYSLVVEGRFSSSGAITATNAIGFQFLVDGSSVKDGSDAFLTTLAQWSRLSHQVFLNAGQTVKVQARNQNASPIFSAAPTFNIQRLSGPSAIAATETVAGRWVNRAGTSIGTSSAYPTAVIPFASSDPTGNIFDTHGMASGSGTTWRVTAPVSGKYLLAANIAVDSTASSPSIQFYKNGTTIVGSFRQYQSAGNTPFCAGSQTVSLNAGDYIQVLVFAFSSGPMLILDGQNVFTMTRVGN